MQSCFKFHENQLKNKFTNSVFSSLYALSYRTRSTVFLSYIFYVNLHNIKMMPIFTERVLNCFLLGMFTTTFQLSTIKFLYGHDLQIKKILDSENQVYVEMTLRSSFCRVQACFHPISFRLNSMKLTQNAPATFRSNPLLHIHIKKMPQIHV